MKTILRSYDISCPSCIARIERVLGRVDGVTDATVRYASGQIVVRHDARMAPPRTLIRAMREAGYESKVSHF